MLNILFILWLITILLGTILLCAENEHYINLSLDKHYSYFSSLVPFKKKHRMNSISNSYF